MFLSALFLTCLVFEYRKIEALEVSCFTLSIQVFLFLFDLVWFPSSRSFFYFFGSLIQMFLSFESSDLEENFPKVGSPCKYKRLYILKVKHLLTKIINFIIYS